jgi:hypothetical protein
MQIPELDFEIPPEAQRGTLSTVCFVVFFIYKFWERGSFELFYFIAIL